MAAMLAAPGVGNGLCAEAARSVVEIPGPAGPLQGALLAAAPRSPAVLIVPGSGPTDRDGNSPLGVASSSYRLLVEALAARGITSLRIDKRGLFGSRAAIADANAVTIADYAADVRSWAARLRAITGNACVWLVGHSEGGLVALAAADSEGICGVVLLAAPGRPMGDVLRAQLRTNPANAAVLEPALAAIAALEQGGAVDVRALPPPLRPLFDARIQPFLRDAMGYDPARLLAACKKPALIVQGERDIQIPVADAHRLHASNPGAALALLPGVNHVLKVVASDDRAANLAAYADAGHPIAPGVVDAIAGFVTRRSAAP